MLSNRCQSESGKNSRRGVAERFAISMTSIITVPIDGPSPKTAANRHVVTLVVFHRFGEPKAALTTDSLRDTRRVTHSVRSHTQRP